MLKTLLCDENNNFKVVEDAGAIDEIVHDRARQLWIDLEDPTPEDFRLIQEEFGLHPLAIEDATVRHQRPKIDQYANFYFVVFYSIVCQEPDAPEPLPGRRGLRGNRFIRHYDEGNSISLSDARSGQDAGGTSGLVERIVTREISMFMGENYLITVHEHAIGELDEIARRWYRNVEAIRRSPNGNGKSIRGTRPLTPVEEEALKPKTDAAPHPLITKADGSYGPGGPPPGSQNHPDHVEEASGDGVTTRGADSGILLYSLLDTIVDGYFPVVDTLVDRIEGLEEEIFERFSQAAIEQVFELKKDLLTIRKVLAPERDVLNILTRRDLPIFDQHTLVYFQDVYDHVVRITDSIDTYRDLLSSALDSYLSMQSNRLNITVQTLTSVSIMLMSVAAVTGWYGMNFEGMPELRFGYPFVIVAVAIIVAAEFLFFKRKGWL